jgi:hypothetical protein
MFLLMFMLMMHKNEQDYGHVHGHGHWKQTRNYTKLGSVICTKLFKTLNLCKAQAP